MSYADDFRKAYSCDAPPFLPDSLRARLTLLSCLSEKKSRTVFLVNDNETGEKCILKITEKRSPDSAKSECEILSGLNHAGIPRCILFEEDEAGHEYILRSYMEGDVLDRLLKRDGAFKEAHIYEIVLKICAILRYLHRQQPPIIYRDINPCNIVLTANGKVSLIDFGISKKIQIQDKYKSFNTVIVGAIPFISPEQMGYDSTDQRSDIFALGKLMLYLYTGRTDSATPVHSRLGKIIAKCTRQSKERRFSSIKQLENAIFLAQRRQVGHAFAKGVVLACVLAAVAAGAFYLLRPNGAQAPAAASVVSIGVVEKNLPIRSPELIASVRRALQISSDTTLTRDMLADVTEIAISAEDGAGDAAQDGGEAHQPERKTSLSRDYLAELVHFPNLTKLTIDGLQIADLTPIGNLRLQELSITSGRITNVAAIGRMTSLEHLDLSYNPIEDIQALSSLAHLKTLDLSYTYLRNAAPLENLTELEALHLRAARVTDFAPLAGLKRLSSLKISHVQIKNFSFLESLTELTQLELRSTGFGDLSLLKSPRLESLDISLNYNFLTDISGLERFSALRELDISLDDIEDYSPLYALPVRTLGIHQDQADRLLLSDVAQMRRLNKIMLTANELGEPWQALGRESGIEVILRPYYEAF